MQATTQQNRQGRGCGFEPAPPPGIRVGAWTPPFAAKLGYKHKLPVICAGYSTRLPEVVEVARAHTHWKTNAAALEAFCGGPPSDVLLAYVEILDAEISHVKAYAMTPRDEGGGRD